MLTRYNDLVIASRIPGQATRKYQVNHEDLRILM